MDLIDPQMPFSQNSDTLDENAQNVRKEARVQKPGQSSNPTEIDPVIPHELNEFQEPQISQKLHESQAFHELQELQEFHSQRELQENSGTSIF